MADAAGGHRRHASRPAVYDSSVIEPGERAPDFELPDQDGEPVKLADLRGQAVVLFFYPKADTPGCTTQACGVRDHHADYSRAGARVLGVSPDPVAKVKRFHDKQSLNFTLLADEDHSVAERYGVWVQKSMYGRTYFGNERTTFVIDADGRVATALRKVKPGEHDDKVLSALSGLGTGRKNGS
jgi:thioredoxin-dependent peroxiredoxin